MVAANRSIDTAGGGPSETKRDGAPEALRPEWKSVLGRSFRFGLGLFLIPFGGELRSDGLL